MCYNGHTMTYLTTPCPRCTKTKLLPAEKHATGARWYTRCEACGLKSLYVIHDHADGTQAYSVVEIGKPNRGMVRATFWITREQKQKLETSPLGQSEELRKLLDTCL